MTRKSPRAMAVQNAMDRARAKAWRRLAERHPDEYRQLYDEERRAEGLPPVRTYVYD